MCGIAGFSNLLEPDRLQAACEAMVHRGPDDFGLFQDSDYCVGLGHRRLSILDLSRAGHQPMHSADGAVVLVFNGEIYNFRELRTELQDQGFAFQGNSDTEVLLNLYLAQGEAMLTRLNGIFAFSLWDSRSRSLLLSRDGLGVKPLYYALCNGSFVFASEIKALLRLLPEHRDLDTSALQRYLTFSWCPGEGTPLRLVRKLLPGEAMVVREGSIERRWCWYRLPSFRPVVSYTSDQDSLIKGTYDHLRTAVQRQMVADVPVGAFLSGGLDSSAVVALAREQNPAIRCFTIEIAGGQEVGTTDDLPYARRAAEYLGVSLDVVQIDASRVAADLERMVVQLEEPLADPAPLNVLYISQLAREQGIKVLMSGVGGDDLFTGYRRHRALLVDRWWCGLPPSSRNAIAWASGALNKRNFLGRRLAKFFGGACLDGDAQLIHYFRWASRADLEGLFSPEFRRSLQDEPVEAPLVEYLRDLPSDTDRLERLLALEQRFFLADHNLLYTDKMSMAAGVEVRVPFLDLELVDYASRIPSRFKQRGRSSKWVLKKAMELCLPHDLIYRPKTGFGMPLRRWMRHELRELLLDTLSEASILRRGLFDPAGVQRLIANNDSGKVDASYTLLSLLCIEIWCRSFLDKAS